MKFISLVLLATIGFSQNGWATLVCSGQNDRGRSVVLTIEVSKAINNKGYKSANISYGYPEEALDGCQGADVVSMKNGVETRDFQNDLYISCGSHGQSGSMHISPLGNGRIEGRFYAPNGKWDLGLQDMDEVWLKCAYK